MSRDAAARILNVADARRRARRILPAALFDYIEGGAEDEVTVAENERAGEAAARRREGPRQRVPEGRRPRPLRADQEHRGGAARSRAGRGRRGALRHGRAV